MILPPQFLIALVQNPQLSMDEARLVLLNFLHYKKGVYVPEVLTVPIVDVTKFEIMVTIACNYFIP